MIEKKKIVIESYRSHTEYKIETNGPSQTSIFNFINWLGLMSCSCLVMASWVLLSSTSYLFANKTQLTIT